MLNGFVTRPFDDQGFEMKRETQERGLGLKCSLVCTLSVVITNQSKQVSGGDSSSQGTEGRKDYFRDSDWVPPPRLRG